MNLSYYKNRSILEMNVHEVDRLRALLGELTKYILKTFIQEIGFMN